MGVSPCCSWAKVPAQRHLYGDFRVGAAAIEHHLSQLIALGFRALLYRHISSPTVVRLPSKRCADSKSHFWSYLSLKLGTQLARQLQTWDPVTMAPDFAALLLAGGRARRLGGQHKPALHIAGSSLLERAVLAVSDAKPIIVVGPELAIPQTVVWTRESPPHAGPVAAIAAGLAQVDAARLVAVLATDVPGIKKDTIDRLRAAMREDLDGAVLVDENGREQWLMGVWRTESVRRALPDTVADVSVRSVFGALTCARLPAKPGEARDIDTTDDLDAWIAHSEAKT